ncbi:hypothetical protein HDU67_000119 [Dinochytrium kinnereticum]|nr:hypothetical protein HDU67_000119 [Dinochytrium kinnereticum]
MNLQSPPLLTPSKPFHATPSSNHGSHDHSHHSHDLIDRSSRAGTRITLVGLGSNVVLTVGKGVGGVVWGSASLVADAVHSLLDLVSDVVTLFTFRKARSGRDDSFPYGYGKLEPLGSLSISGILLAGGLGTGYHSLTLLYALLTPTSPNPITSPDLLNPDLLSADSTLSLLALGVIVTSIAVKEALFWSTLRVARKTGSDVLVANAWHHRADSVSTLVALVGVGGRLAGWEVLDPVGGVVVSGMIIQASLGMLLPALRDLTDRAPQDVVTRTTQILTEMLEMDKNIVGFKAVRGRKMGPDYFIDLQLQVSPRISVSQSHQISENVRHAVITKVPRITEVLIHVDVDEHDHLTHPVTTPSATSSIEHEISVKAMKGFEHEVKRISHLSVHFLSSGLEVDAEIVPMEEETMTFKQAVGLAQRFRRRLLMLEGVVGADVHLETTEHEEE